MMDWKLSYGTLGLIALVLSAGLVWYNIENAPQEVAMTISFDTAAPLLNPYPELEGLKIPINTASEEELQLLPDIGPTRAKAIRAYITENGSLTKVNQLLEVEGLGEGIVDKILPYIVFS